MRSDPAAYTIRIQQLLFGLGLFGLGLLATRGAMGGGMGGMKMVGYGIVIVTIVLLTDKHYWILWPLAYWGRSLIGGRNLVELACIAIIGTHFVRRALRRETHTRMQPALLFMVPYLLWVAVAFIQNPPGFFALGGRTIGARFYVQIGLGFAAGFVLAIQKLDENDCRLMYRGIVWVVTLALLRQLLFRQLVQQEGSETTAYELLTAATLVYLLLARYRFVDFVGLNWRFFLLGLLGLLSVYTGKRRAVFNVGIFPLLRAIISRQDVARAFLATVGACCCVLLLALGQGRIYELPINIQRGLSFLPGRWDARVEHFAGGRDPFREFVREHAWNQVRLNPWFGRKGFAFDLEEMRWVSFSGRDLDHSGHGISGNWHNTWIGMMADFGIPGAVFWGLFSIGFVVFGWRKVRACPVGSYQHTMATFLLCVQGLVLIASHTSGHSAMLPFNYWPMFGLLLGINPPAPGNGIGSRDLDHSGDLTSEDIPPDAEKLPRRPMLKAAGTTDWTGGASQGSPSALQST